MQASNSAAEVFRINDIDLKVPPTAIQINQEDLLYSWKTLRTSTSTKIASGQGHIRVHVSIPFTNGMLLDLHRLVTEFKHSPFCSIDNNYLRHTIVPDWADFQQMAFTMTSINVNPLPDSSDTWICELDLLWFNYLPYSHNFLYKDDWSTDWIALDGEDTKQKYRLSIGWELDESFKRTPRFSIVDTLNIENPNEAKRWSLATTGYSKEANKVLKDIEAMHYGESFDLLPIPSGMIPANFVFDARNSRIYTRYINYLQRDALIKNFGFNVEEDLSTDVSAFFSTVKEENVLATYSLTSNRVPLYIHNKWISKMLETNSGISFKFHIYKNIKINPELLKKVRAEQGIPDLEKPNTGKTGTSYILNPTRNAAGPDGAFVEVRNGWWAPAGMHTPVGVNANTARPATIQEALGLVRSTVKLRSEADDQRLYAGDSSRAAAAKGTRVHAGTDFGVPVGTPIFAVADGVVSRSSLGSLGEGIQWSYVDKSTKLKRGKVKGSSFQADWEDLVSKTKLPFNSATVQLTQTVWQTPGTVIKSSKHANVYYIAEYTSAGQSLRIEHATGESVYMHLGELTVTKGKEVKAGDLIGYTGRSSAYTDSFLESQLNTTNIPFDGYFIKLNPDILLQQDPSLGVYSLSPHLHFEFRENRELPGVTDRTSTYNPSEIGGRVLVNPVPSWNEALDKNTPRLPDSLKPPTATEKESSAEIANAEDVTSTGTGDLLKTLHALGSAGWMYYEGSIKVSDIWQKVVEVNIQNQNNSGPDFVNQGAVLMNVSGGLRHIVANIPILSHEYPTQQHLGSIEPVYSIDFAIRDDNLDGLSDEGKLLQSLRNLLQFNAREFRSIPDAWCVCTDTFITRFFGTYQVNDYSLEEINILGLEDTEKFSLPVVTKRSSIMRSGANTSPTNPGVSFINFEVQETNPFSVEKIMPTSITRSDKEAIRKKVLQKLYSLDFITKDASLATIVALGQATNKDFFEVGSSEFGKLSIPSFTDSSELSAAGFPDIALVSGNADGNKILVKIRGTERENYEGAPLSGFQQLLSGTGGFNQSELEEYLEIPESAIGTGILSVSPDNDFIIKDQSNGTTAFDFSELILDSRFDAKLANINYAKLLEYHRVLKDTLRYAEFTIAEHSSKKRSDIPYALDEDSFIGLENRSSEGLLNEEVSKELYDLPFDAKMWRAWQQWLILTIYRIGGSSGLNEATNDPSWMTWQETLPSNDVSLINRLSGETFNLDFKLRQSSHGVSDIVPLLVSSIPGAANNKSLYYSIASTVFQNYSDVFPLSYNFQFLGDSWDYNNLIGSLAGISDTTSRPRAFERFEFALSNCLATSKYLGPKGVGLNGGSAYGSGLAFISKTNPINHTVNDFINSSNILASGQELYSGVNSTSEFDASNLFKKYQSNDYSGKFTYIVTTAAEKEKVNFFKLRLADLAQSIIADSKLMEAMGLLDEALVVQEGNPNETDAYPDLTLPFHPFFGDTLSSDPDFYFWNIYDDGQAFGQQVQSVIKDNVFSIVENSYNSIKLMEQGKTLDPAVGASGKGLVEEIGMESFKIPLKFSAEGTDSAIYGPMGSVFNMTPEMTLGAENFFDKIGFKKEEAKKDAANVMGVKAGGSEPVDRPTGKFGNIELLVNPVAAISMSATEGVEGVGSGFQYSSRLSIDEYKALRKELKDITKMFGTRKGFSEANITNDNSPLADRTATSLLGRPDEYTHGFDKSSLQKLALDSSKDIASRRMSLKRAIPTFKLYFVEEDENETRTINLDDFYSYNAVHSFTCELSKKSAADHLIITLQNVSGTLDGTAHNALVDLDYFDKDIKKLVPEGASTYSGNSLNQDTQSDQPFNSIVLRPGLNVQLRAGYSNDPDNLHVLISGRVVDIQWNKNGDLAELLVQSYGTELIQQIKGTQRDSDNKVFYTTHELLGNLMLSPELAHFGRWEIGQLTQHGESKDARLDFYDYRDKSSIDYSYLTRQIDVAREAWNNGRSFIGAGLSYAEFAVTEAVRSGTTSTENIFNLVGQRIANFFTAKKVSLFLSPQDDNLYPPHPKDYMTLDTGVIDNAIKELHGYSQRTSDQGFWLGTMAANGLRWAFAEDLLFDKKANPKDFQYSLISTNIWNVFHEMSLRHPGWIYGARPYGNEYRYTMFFGVPSQRYWSRGASNNFIKRVNDIHDFLDKADSLSGKPLEFEYRKIYGDIVDDRTLKEVNAEADQYVKENLIVSETPEAFALLNAHYGLPPLADGSDNMKASYVRRTLTGKAMKEYLNALNFRFTPFRRYHIFSSQRNLVWNGLLSSENAVINAVDVTYFNEKLNYDGSKELEPVASHVFKAHSFIPEHMLRIAPVRWPNCKGYSVAMRYGMGELIHRMKDMYRGEIIILGNARVRPWDVGILTDTYNDMIGPIEVDQVVHNFSHETGFITEIKPAAIVIGNEISSFPIMEAMKTFSLAVHDIEANYIKLRGGGSPGNYDNRAGLTNPGAVRTVANIMNHWDSEELSRHLREKDPELFDKNGQVSKTLDELVFGGSAPRSELYEGLLNLERRVDAQANAILNPLINTARTIISNPTYNRSVYLGDVLAGDLASAQKYKILRGYAPSALNALTHVNEVADIPSFAWLIGAPLLFLRCLKQDSVIVMPLMKNGRPIVSGLSYSDPTMIWNSVRGELRQLVDDTLDGTRDMISEYATIGSHIWNNFGETLSALGDQEAHVANLPLRGETQ